MKYVSDIIFAVGLVSVFVGITFAYSWPVACIIAGTILMIIATAVAVIKALAKIKGGP